jgi:hypothetical protein
MSNNIFVIILQTQKLSSACKFACEILELHATTTMSPTGGTKTLNKMVARLKFL